MRPVVQFAFQPELSEIEHVGEHDRNPAGKHRFAAPRPQSEPLGEIANIIKRVVVGGVGFKELSDKRRSVRVNDDGSQSRLIQIAHQRFAWKPADADFLPDAAFDVFGQIVHVVFRLSENDWQHELALRRVLKPERGEFQGVHVSGVQGVDNPFAVHRVARQAVGMPSKNPLHMPALYVAHHGIEDGATGHFRRAGFHEFAGNMEGFFAGEFAQLGKLRVNGQKLSVVLVGGLTGIEKHFHGAPLNCWVLAAVGRRSRARGSRATAKPAKCCPIAGDG